MADRRFPPKEIKGMDSKRSIAGLGQRPSLFLLALSTATTRPRKLGAPVCYASIDLGSAQK